MAKIRNINYFKQTSKASSHTESVCDDVKDTVLINDNPESESRKEPEKDLSESDKDIMIPRQVQLSSKLLASVKSASINLDKIGFSGLANEMANLYKMAVNKRFTVAFVGEFSRGKSTLINRILGKAILPTSDLPTTAILTRIVYGRVPHITVCGNDGKKIKELSINNVSWEGLTAANFGEQEPEGSVVVEYNDQWLGKFGIDFIDTPGAGDLEDKRTKIIERCMVNADGAIIAIDANKPLSMTEQAFIKQKIMSRGVPFTAIAVTKLDMIKEEERVDVLQCIVNRLKSLKISIPIIVADDSIKLPEIENLKELKILFGIDKLKGLMVAWMANENRSSLMEKWLSINAISIINSAHAFLLQQKQIFDAKDIEKEHLINQRNNALLNMHNKWKLLRDEMKNREQACYEAFNKAANDAGKTMIENLQHEADRQLNPKDWLEKEYSYRVRRELSAISLSLDNLVAKRVTADVHWLNGEMNRQFKEIIGTEIEALMSKEDFLPNVDDQAVKLKSLKDKSTKATIFSSALTLGAALMIGVTGGAPLILATMGVGTAANLISRRSLENEGNHQREALKGLIAQQIPTVIANASDDSSIKIKIIYNDIISESLKIEARWMTAQGNLIRSSLENQGKDAKEQVERRINEIENLVKQF